MRSVAKRLGVAIAALALFSALIGGTFNPSSVALADGSLRLGDKGPAVKELQQLLKNHGCYDFEEITGFFGATTEAGVRKFQTQNGLTVDGVAGADTMKKLKEKTTKPLNPDSLCLGMKNDEVEEIQKRLKELGLYTEPEITGYYGPITEKAVKAFQEASGMTADGIVGKKTKAALNTEFKSTTIIPGKKGQDVEKLQTRLKTLGYYNGPVTGLYGQMTKAAVAYYQKLNNLTQDGICGSTTYKSLFAKNAKTEKDASRAKPAATPKPTPKYTAVPGQSVAGQEKGEAIVAYVKKFLGKPYVYGASGPNSFDCTGLTCYVYKHFGVTLPRSAKNQGHTEYGVKITSRSKLMPGDLVFFKKNGAYCHHAGLYVGNGQFIHAPNTGDVVRYGDINKARDFAWGRRVFK